MSETEDELRRLDYVQLNLRFERAAAGYPDSAIETFREEYRRFEQRVRAFAAVHRTPDAVLSAMETETSPLPDAVVSAWDVERDPPKRWEMRIDDRSERDPPPASDTLHPTKFE